MYSDNREHEKDGLKRKMESVYACESTSHPINCVNIALQLIMYEVI